MKSDLSKKKNSVLKGKDPRRKIPGGGCLVEEVSTSTCWSRRILTQTTVLYTYFEVDIYFMHWFVAMGVILCCV